LSVDKIGSGFLVVIAIYGGFFIGGEEWGMEYVMDFPCRQ
jgi:hypothetical protein